MDAGLRVVFNPGAVVEVSGILALSALFNGEKWQTLAAVLSDLQQQEDSQYLRIDWSRRNYSIGAKIGIALERKLLEQLYLRLESGLFRIYWAEAVLKESSEQSVQRSTSSVFGAGLAFSPMIQLRFLI